MSKTTKEMDLKQLRPRYNRQVEKRHLISFKFLFIIFLIMGIILFRHNIIQVKVITAKPRTTIVGEGIFIQSYEKCPLQVKVSFKLPECRYISKTELGYLIKLPIVKTKLEIITLKPKITIAGRNIFVQSLEPCRPKFKLVFL